MLNLPLVDSTGRKGVNFIVANILARKSTCWGKLFNYISKPLGKAYGY